MLFNHTSFLIPNAVYYLKTKFRMKKSLLFLLIILVGCHKYDKSELIKIGIYKEIKSYRIITYNVSKENKKDTFQTKTFRYNNKGRLIRSLKFN